MPYCIVEIRKKDGSILYSREEPEPVDVLDNEVLDNCRELLHAVVQRGSGRAAKVNDDVFGKTGSNGDTDAWFIGFYDPPESEDDKPDRGLAFGVWVGNDSLHDKMTSNSTGGRIPTRIIARFLKSYLKNKPNEEKQHKSNNSEDLNSHTAELSAQTSQEQNSSEPVSLGMMLEDLD